MALPCSRLRYPISLVSCMRSYNHRYLNFYPKASPPMHLACPNSHSKAHFLEPGRFWSPPVTAGRFGPFGWSWSRLIEPGHAWSLLVAPRLLWSLLVAGRSLLTECCICFARFVFRMCFSCCRAPLDFFMSPAPHAVLRVPPEVTRLTVYRWLQIPNQV